MNRDVQIKHSTGHSTHFHTTDEEHGRTMSGSLAVMSPSLVEGSAPGIQHEVAMVTAIRVASLRPSAALLLLISCIICSHPGYVGGMT